ncbi:histidine phosphatase family protein [Hutsoniella sourekii]|uniref:histidine phosphatase family protein n=1 Tax=Hutsoniella sourekii TaxID=87650 RepID=UPI000489FCCB|nr:histidine phosphatase family protein [Hutsoniella sourekii]
MSQGVTFYFVRHGETYFNQYNRMQGWANAPLTDKGIADVRRSGRGLNELEFDAVYTSDLQRTIDTAQIILEENQHADKLTIQPMYAFREVFFGSFEGLPAKDIWPKVTQEVDHDLPVGGELALQRTLNLIKKLDPYGEAENYVEFWNRVEAGLLELLNKHSGTGQNILVVCHGLTIRNLLEALVADFDEVEPLDNASVSIVKYENGQFKMTAYNQTDHFKDVAKKSDSHD